MQRFRFDRLFKITYFLGAIIGGPVLSTSSSSFYPDSPSAATFEGSCARPPDVSEWASLPQPSSYLQSPSVLPRRFLLAGKNNPLEGFRRFYATLDWRKAERVDSILKEPSPYFNLIKRYYPHFFHGRGRNNEPVFYERPGQTNIKQLREAGITLEDLLRHYIFITEFQWQIIEPRDSASSINVIDLAGIRMTDFVGDTIKFLKLASSMCAQHYPERAGTILIINVPTWFRMIWGVVQPLIDEATLRKIFVLRGKEEIRNRLQEKIPIENIPPEYGGTSVPLGQSREEKLLWDLVCHNNALAAQRRNLCKSCEGIPPDQWPCWYCQWTPHRSY